jgi:diguanylate cyclase (GGDEF)-like protein
VPGSDSPPVTDGSIDSKLVELVRATGAARVDPASGSESSARRAEAEDTLRAIGAGEVDAFVLSDGEGGQRVFTLSTADRPYRMFVENMREGAATLSASGLILYANRRLAELLSCPRDTIVGARFETFLPAGVGSDVVRVGGRQERGAALEIDLVDGNGVAVPMLIGASPLEVDGDQLTCLTFTDLSAQKAQEDEINRLSQAQDERLADLEVAQAALLEQATHDALTGLPNRALLVDRIDQALYHATRSGRSIAVLFVDLDRFKHVNDTHGHAAGDSVLRRVADQLVALVRPMDTVARIGGDEFVVLAADVDSDLHAVDISARLVAELGRRREVSGDGERVAASIGVSVSLGGRGTAEVLLGEADTAMYHAKSLGGGRVEVFDAVLGRQVKQRSIAREMLQAALDDCRVVVHYQPIVGLSTRQVAGFEALARIAAEDGTILPPAAFIPAAEDSGLVVPLGTQVLDLACREASRWQSDTPGTQRLTVAVNLSPRQFERGDLAAIVRSQVETSGLDPACLHLELTETAIIDLHPDLLHQLGEIRELGVEIGLDDFGTGYASLTHLRRLPLTFVKIDQSFVQGLGTGSGDDRIVGAVVDLAANLRLRSIGEGVETPQQLERLRDLGCDQAQGFFFARPMGAGDVPEAIGHPAW